jgi:hypothetical protein
MTIELEEKSAGGPQETQDPGAKTPLRLRSGQAGTWGTHREESKKRGRADPPFAKTKTAKGRPPGLRPVCFEDVQEGTDVRLQQRLAYISVLGPRGSTPAMTMQRYPAKEH